ncbi:MAG: hypothetical protein K5694_02970 [Bacilli bacterium]|nr:hypothetical protein [Bacilli bacterium]
MKLDVFKRALMDVYFLEEEPSEEAVSRAIEIFENDFTPKEFNALYLKYGEDKILDKETLRIAIQKMRHPTRRRRIFGE